MEAELEKQPNPVNTPTSGTYGEKAALDSLKQALPPMQEKAPATPPAGGAPSGPPITPTPAPGQQAPQAPTGVPDVLLAPTGRPMEPVSGPIAEPQQFPGSQQTAAQERLEMLINLANSPRVSDETREWAQLYVESLASAGE